MRSLRLVRPGFACYPSAPRRDCITPKSSQGTSSISVLHKLRVFIPSFILAPWPDFFFSRHLAMLPKGKTSVDGRVYDDEKVEAPTHTEFHNNIQARCVLACHSYYSQLMERALQDTKSSTRYPSRFTTGPSRKLCTRERPRWKRRPVQKGGTSGAKPQRFRKHP